MSKKCLCQGLFAHFFYDFCKVFHRKNLNSGRQGVGEESVAAFRKLAESDWANFKKRLDVGIGGLCITKRIMDDS